MGRLFDSKQFRDDLSLSGSFSGSFQGDGSGLTNIPTTSTASYALSASYAITSETASYVLNSVSSSYSSFAVTASYAVSASHEIIKEISSSYADTASFAQSGNGIFSGSFSGSYVGDGSNLIGITSGIFHQTGSYYATTNNLQITGSLLVTGSISGVQGVINSLTASYSITSSYIASSSIDGISNYVRNNQTSSMTVLSSSFATTASYVLNSISSSYSSFAISASYSVSSSHEIIKEVSSSYADTASFAQSGNGIFSGSFSGSFQGNGSGLTGLDPFPFSGSALITGSLSIVNNNDSNYLGDGSVQGRGLLAVGSQVSASRLNSVAFGELTKANAQASFAQGYNTIVEYRIAADQASYAHAEGWETSASAYGAHSEGYRTQAGSIGKNAFGPDLGRYSHAEGWETKTLAFSSHAEGYQSQAGYLKEIAPGFFQTRGNYSHAEGQGTIASGSYQHVQGKYNTYGNDTSLMIIGNGTDDSNRSDLALFNANGIVFNQPLTASIISSSFIGDGSGLTGIISSSYADTASYIISSSIDGISNYVRNNQTSSMTVLSSSFATTASYVLNSITSSYSSFAVSASYALSSSHEIIKEVSSSYADTASFAQSGNGIFSGSFSGSFHGDGSGLTDIPASGIVGLNLSQIASGSATASISPNDGFVVNTDTTISGSLIVEGSGSTIFEVQGSSGQLFSVSDDLTGILMEVNDISGIPLFQVSSSGLVEINVGNISGSATSTASFGTYLGDGSQLTNLPLVTSASYALTASYVETAQTASYILNAVSSSFSSFAISASYSVSSSHEIIKEVSSSYADTASFAESGNGIFSGSFSGSYVGDGSGLTNVPTTTTASYALTASYVETAQTASYVISSSIDGIIDYVRNNQTSSMTVLSSSYSISSSHSETTDFILGGNVSGPVSDAVTAVSSSYSLTASYIETAQTASYVLNSVSSSYSSFAVSASYAVSASHEIIKEISSSYADTASFAQSGNGIFSGSFSGSYVGDGSGLTGVDPFPFSGSAVITGSLLVSGSATPIEVIGSGSRIFSVQGSLGELFAIDDVLSGSLIVINDESGIPQFEVFSDGRTLIGADPRSLYTSATISSTTLNVSQSIYSLSTSSYDGVFFDYTVTSASNARAGNIMSIWNGGNLVYTENTTTDIGSTVGVTFNVEISQSLAQLISVTDTAGWKIKTTIRSI